MIAPDAWTEWTLSDVGIFDAAIFLTAATTVYTLTQRDNGQSADDEFRSSATDLPSESGSKLEANDTPSKPQQRDPNELPSLFER